MKTHRLIITLVAALIASSLQAFELDGLYYEATSSTTVRVTEHWPQSSGTVTVPSQVTDGGVTYTVTAIGDGAFRDDLITGIVLPETLTAIGSEAFAHCTQLQSIAVPDGVVSIGNRAFADCTKLAQLTLGANITTVPYGMCMNDLNLTSIEIPELVTEIAGYAFAGCSYMNLVVIGSSVSVIGNSAFFECQRLRYVDVHNIALWCTIDFEGSEDNPLTTARRLLHYGESVNVLEIPEGIERLKPYIFSGVMIDSVALPSTLRYYDLLAIDRSNLKHVFVPDGVTEVNAPSYIELRSADKLTLGSGVRELPESSFFPRYIWLSEIILKEGLEVIGPNVFARTNISEIVIPNSVREINGAFGQCTMLRKVYIGSGLRRLGNFAFHSCPNISEIHINIPDPSKIDFVGGGQFGSINNNLGLDKTTCVLYVPQGSVELYRNNRNWSDFVNIVEDENMGVYGDADGNGKVEIDDINVIINILTRKASFDDYPAADVDGNGKVDVDDMNIIINILTHKI